MKAKTIRMHTAYKTDNQGIRALKKNLVKRAEPVVRLVSKNSSCEGKHGGPSGAASQLCVTLFARLVIIALT